MKSKLEKLLYKLCSTEVKMLIDKIEAKPQVLGIGNDGRVYSSHNFVGILIGGSFTLRDRAALALMRLRVRRENTRVAILTAIFEGEMRDRSESVGDTVQAPMRVMTAQSMAKEAQRVLTKEMKATFDSHAKDYVDTARKQGVL